jgi:hypothetical protein
MVARDLTHCGYGKLGKGNLTDTELYDLCYKILGLNPMGLTSRKLSTIIHTKYHKTIPVRRISMNLNSDSRFIKGYSLKETGRQDTLIWKAKVGMDLEELK